MKSKVLFQTGENRYLQDVINDYLLYLPPELFNQIEKRLNDPTTKVEDNSNYYDRKAEFLINKLSDPRITLDA